MKQIPLAWRWRMLLAGIPVLLLVAYQFNIARTIALVRSYNAGQRAFDVSLADFNSERKHAITEDKGFYPGDNNMPDSFFYLFTTYCDTNHVDIVSIGQTFFAKDSITVETNKITVTGAYRDILQLLFSIEHERKINPVNAVTFELLNDRANEKYTLSSVLYIKRLVHEK